jgi:hypothetical protein
LHSNHGYKVKKGQKSEDLFPASALKPKGHDQAHTSSARIALVAIAFSPYAVGILSSFEQSSAPSAIDRT